MMKSALSSLLAFAVIAGATAAEAATKKVKLDVNELAGDGTMAVAHMGLSITIDDAGLGIVSVPFVLPANYKANSTLKVKVHYAIEETGCNLLAGAAGVLRARKGKLPSILGSSDAGSGLTTVGGEIFAAPAVAGALATKTVRVARPTAGTILSQKPGDTVTLMFGRAGFVAGDTCTSSMAVTGATILYETN
jgi:hypothetical protein